MPPGSFAARRRQVKAELLAAGYLPLTDADKCNDLQKLQDMYTSFRRFFQVCMSKYPDANHDEIVKQMISDFEVVLCKVSPYTLGKLKSVPGKVSGELVLPVQTRTTVAENTSVGPIDKPETEEELKEWIGLGI